MESVVTIGRPENLFVGHFLALWIRTTGRTFGNGNPSPSIQNSPVSDLEKARSILLSNEPGPHPEGEPLGQAPEGSPRQQGSLPAKLTHNSPRFDVKALTTLAPDRKNSFLTCSFRSWSKTS